MRVIILLITALALSLFSEELSFVDSVLTESIEEKPEPLRNPWLTTSLSLIPGGGQVYSKKYISGGLFLSTELLLGTVMINRYSRYENSRQPYVDAFTTFDRSRYILTKMEEPAPVDEPLKLVLDSSATAQDSVEANTEYLRLKAIYTKYQDDSTTYSGLVVDTVNARNGYTDAKYDHMKWSTSYNNYLSWFAQIYLWNLIDGFALSNKFQGWDDPIPSRAGWLSAIPFTGAGQVYNGNLFKAGLVSTMQLQCILSAFRYNDLIDFSQTEYKAEVAKGSDYSSDQKRLWRDRYKDNKDVQTRFLWYAVIFYIYGIADAYIDAELDDFDSHFRILPEFDPKSEALGAKLEVEF